MQNSPEAGQGTHHPGTSTVDYEAMHAEALDLNHDAFLTRAETETNENFANDLRLTAKIAKDLQAEGLLALTVGGYVRDAVIARETGEPQTSKDIDVEVYGIEFEALASKLAAYGKVSMVGESFGIAILTNAETNGTMDFSIPRKDSKVDKGHKGFKVTGDPEMSVKDAARRRDVTVNSLAMNPLTGEVIDHYEGIQDIKNGVLRATDMELFPDDPLRVLRVMQFAGRFDFKVEPETAELCRRLDLTELSSDRIGKEWDKLMLGSKRPSVGLEVARDLGILDQLHPDLAVLDQIQQEPDWHPEGNVWEHTKLAADAAARIVREEGLEGEEAMQVLYGALCHDLGKATTTQKKWVERDGRERWIAHKHDIKGVEPTTRFMKQLKQPNERITAITHVVREHLYHLNNPNPSNRAVRDFAKRLEPANIRLYDFISRADSNGRGQEWEPETASHQIYLKAMKLEVAVEPMPRIMEGKDVRRELMIDGGIELGRAVEVLYQAQMNDEFNTPVGAVNYIRDHHREIEAEVVRQTEEYNAQKIAYARAKKAEIIEENRPAKEVKQAAHRMREAERESRLKAKGAKTENPS